MNVVIKRRVAAHNIDALNRAVVATVDLENGSIFTLSARSENEAEGEVWKATQPTVGAKNVETVCQAADELGIEYLTLYAFSTENWNRPDSEVAALMKLLESYLKNCIRTANKNNMRVRVIGELSRLSESFQKKIQELEEVSAANTGLNLTIAINYGSRDEMLRAMKHMFTDIKNGRITEEEINEKTFSGYLDTRELPDPDLLIRTSGEQRLSNYLLWQLAYSEFYFTDVPWPDFHKKELELAVEAYNKRDRRFGGLKEEE